MPTRHRKAAGMVKTNMLLVGFARSVNSGRVAPLGAFGRGELMDTQVMSIELIGGAELLVTVFFMA